MDNRFDLFKKLLLDSDLPDKAVEDLVRLFSSATDEEIDAVNKVISRDDGWIKEFYNNYLSKQQALKNKDFTAWKKIVEEEGKQLENLPE